MRGSGEFIEYTNTKKNKLTTHQIEMREGLVFMRSTVRKIEQEN